MIAIRFTKTSVDKVCVTFHSTRVFLNQITTLHRDRYTMTPEYKVTAVRIEKLEPVTAK